ncbi:deoxyribose-phosphate aldolase [Halomonas binhaiensis]|uniref:Deoxyribose-phosphate aldolase n=1 Tax=Halomonas binhaiensis TaxID=2562282 RepID=A0A5C1NIK4_9GAMM|nr:deoxyribose-phosphate aldolase [Halomonas binhaiensis]QEM82473.1 deoxyribose-phosphate aldolase [Halomonas binhaiensis]
MNDLTQIAHQALALMDLTSLNDDDDEACIETLCHKARTAAGHPAAICIYPQFIHTAQRALEAEGLAGKVKIATVTNFPAGGDDIQVAVTETRAAIAAGADEVDVVFPYRAMLAGNNDIGRELVSQCKAACGERVLKVILETGELQDAALIRRAAEQAVAGGADFLKTSTGKVEVNATPEAARVLLEVIRDADRPVAFKAAGGVRSAEDAARYLDIASDIMGPAWATPETFRFGASGLLDNLLATLNGKSHQEGSAGDY